ncbi:phosphoserine phosphatase SerB [Pseudomonadales bacterium]|nr:phosphoserine phosphatase SerB [Pseudomonadales bacterium]MDB2596247.1 phosphoserine phosphatase SerB [Pseudomonadales bacterium]
MADEIILISISGRDKPGLMAELMELIVEADANVLDMGQAVIHDELALGILVQVPELGTLTDDITAQCHKVGSALRITLVENDNYELLSAGFSQSPLILTVLSQGRGGEPLKAVSNLTRRYDINIDTVRRLTKPQPNSQLEVDSEVAPRLCLEMRLSGSLQNSAAFQAELLGIADDIGFDFSVQRDTVFRRNRRLVAFDMDSTLITEEVMDELAKRHGVGEQVIAITEDAMAGRIDFKESFRRRAMLLKGMPASVLHEVAEAVVLNNGADKLIRALKHFGYRVALLSGGFQYVGEYLSHSLGIDYVYANELRVVDGKMTGEVVGDIVDAEGKATLLKDIARREGIMLEQTIAVGDGANDLPMLSQAGLGVAYHAKSIVKESAQHAISNFGLDAILYLIGFSDLDIEQALGASVQKGPKSL